MDRKILHLDLDAFYCAVEENADESLRGKAFAVGGQPDQRGVVASCSYAARRYGVHSAMPMSQAVRLCPHLVIIPHHFEAYRAASREVMQRLHELTPIVEQLSIDEAFLDATGLQPSPRELAHELQATIAADLELPCSLGAATNKLVAKIANNVGKARAGGDGPPNAITVVEPGDEAAFLAPLDIRELWGVGPKTAAALHRMGVRTIGDIARQADAVLVRQFGKHGADLARHARGIDERPVQTEEARKQVSKETTFSRDVGDGEALRRTLRRLADSVGWRLRKAGLSGTTVRLKLRWPDFTTLTRQMTLEAATNSDDAIYAAALKLFEAVWSPGRPVRLIGVGVSGFDAPARQLGLWDEQPQEATGDSRLQDALDELRGRFGEESIRRGSTFSGEEGET